MTKKGKCIPMKGGLASMHSIDREMAGKTSAISNKEVLPKSGHLFGSDKLGNFGGVQGGKPIVKEGKRKSRESGFGI